MDKLKETFQIMGIDFTVTAEKTLLNTIRLTMHSLIGNHSVELEKDKAETEIRKILNWITT